MRAVIILLGVLFVYSCKNEIRRVDNISENSSGQRPSVTEKDAKKNRKFSYVVLMLESPRLVHTDPVYITKQGALPGRTYQERIEGWDYIVWDEKAFTTGIVEVDEFNEDEKYRLLDKAEYEFRQVHYPIIDAQYESSVINKVRSFQIKEKLRKERTRIIKREVLSFDSYAEASRSKRKSLLNK